MYANNDLYIKTIHANYIATICDDHEGKDTSIFTCLVDHVDSQTITLKITTEITSDYKILVNN